MPRFIVWEVITGGNDIGGGLSLGLLQCIKLSKTEDNWNPEVQFGFSIDLPLKSLPNEGEHNWPTL